MTGNPPSLQRSHYGMNVLTARELQVLTHACEGQSDQEIAAALGIARLTVRHHMRQVYEKLGVNRRCHAIITAMKSGLIRPLWLQDLEQAA